MTADQATWIEPVVAERCSGAVQCADPYHLVAWASDALDEARRRVWNDGAR